jgi:hypothetical protein
VAKEGKDLCGVRSMSRGPQISQGLGLAIPFALKRGQVMVFMAALLNLAEFLITGNGLFVLVRVRLARRIRTGIAEIEAEFADAIAGLRLVPRTGPVSCELWLYSRHGTLRHFRIEDTGIVEIDCYGAPLGQVKPVTGPAFTPDKTGTVPGPASAGTVRGPAASVIDPKSPIYRWLVKWNAAQKAGDAAGSIGSSELRKILDAGKPGGVAKQSAGKKPGRKKVKAAGPDDPEKRQEPGAAVAPAGEPVAAEMPESSSSTGYSYEAPSSDGNHGRLEHTGIEPPTVPGTKEEAI